MGNLKSDSTLIINADEPNLIQIKNSAPGKVITFGVYQEADFRGVNVSYDESGFAQYEVEYKGESYPVNLPVMGLHNVLNSLAAIATSVNAGLDIKEVVSAIEHYRPVHQRLEMLGEREGVTVMDDYAPVSYTHLTLPTTPYV